MNKEKGSGRFLSGKGFYAALTLVITGAAAAGFFAVGNMLDTLETQPEKPQYRQPAQREEEIPWEKQPHTPAEQKKQDVPVKQDASSSSCAPQSASSLPAVPQPSSSTPAKLPAASKAPEKSAVPHVQEPPCFALPTKGESVRSFTGDELKFDQTMKDWRTHNGADFAGEAGTEVFAPASARVVDVSADPQWGSIVELEKDDLLMRLCGLDDVKVASGQSVKAGDVIGTIGTIPAESAEKTHVHLEMIRDGHYIDPEQVLEKR